MGIEPGVVIAGKLRLVSLLGQGAAGQVWLARHLQLGSDVAVKFLKQELSSADTARERFTREARAIARIRSPHVVQIHDFGFHEDHAYLAMEHLVGETLEARLQIAGHLPVFDTLRIVTHIAKGLQRAHDAGIVHRDIKPANVFLVDYGDEEIAKVVDFGIVKSTDATRLAETGAPTLTQTGSLLGTPYYMSPEQLHDSGSVDFRVDLWALAVITYQCIVGKLPFDRPNFPLLVLAICHNPIPLPSQHVDVPASFDAWVARALSRKVEERFSSAREFAGELCQALLVADREGTSRDSLIPPDLLWSGSHPTVRGGRLGSEPPCVLTDSQQGLADSDARTLVTPAYGELAPQLSSRPPVMASTPPQMGDGSLESHIANAEGRLFPSQRRGPSLAVLILGAIALLVAGWSASWYLHPAQPTPAAVPLTTNSQVPAASVAASVAPPPHVPAAASASAEPVAAEPRAVPRPPRKVHVDPSRSGSPAPATTDPPALPKPDPLAERQ